MAKEKNDSTEAPELRRRAEELLRSTPAEAHPSRIEAESQRLLHELGVHRSELETQNAELLMTRDVAETALDESSDIYDFAPVSYLTLDRDGVIHTANLTGATLLGIERARLIAVFDDITARKRAESIVQARFRMIAAATSMSLGDMLQLVLDEIEAQTGSEIGFFHFCDADQETLSLQKWSTNTLRNMCSAQGEGCHYPVSQAGVWVDCVHERRPVIHNDYTSLPNRRGMPPGHAQVLREMVIPILRKDRIVAIIGVGNKPTDYNANDVEVASLLGDFSWEIVDRKIAEEKLRKSEQQLAMAQGIAHIGSWEWDSISDRITGSDEFKRIFGLILSSYDSFIELVHPDDRETVNRAVEETLIHQATYSVQYRIIRPDGFTRVIHAQGAAVTDAAGRTVRVIGTAQDISERKEMEGKLETLLSELAGRAFELESANRELESANIELEAFNYMVAHDLRTPLSNIHGFCQVLQHFSAGNNEDCKKYIEEIYEASERMDRLIGALLEFSRTLRAEMRHDTVDLSAMAWEVAGSLESVEPGRHVKFRIVDGINVNGDASLLHIVLDNIIGNAWKYSGDREGTVIEFGVKEIEGKPTCFIRDNGPGFDMAKADKLFIPFQRIHESKVKGHGIGLATVKRIIQRHGGRVWAEGEPGKGATFYFTLSTD